MFMRRYLGTMMLMVTLFVGIAWFKGDVISYMDKQAAREDARELRREKAEQLQLEHDKEEQRVKESVAKEKIASNERIALAAQVAKDKAEEISRRKAEIASAKLNAERDRNMSIVNTDTAAISPSVEQPKVYPDAKCSVLNPHLHNEQFFGRIQFVGRVAVAADRVASVTIENISVSPAYATQGELKQHVDRLTWEFKMIAKRISTCTGNGTVDFNLVYNFR